MKRQWFLAAVVLLPLLTSSKGKADDVTVRWDIANFVNGGILPGAPFRSASSRCTRSRRIP